MTTTVKVLNAKKEVANYTASKGQPLVIQAQDKVNYQLIDDATGLAPQNIIAKRENNNLVITLEDGDTNPDIIIENYYNDNGESTNLIIGQHENGNLYVYVPESGVSSEAISILAEEVIAPQALGGDVLKSAFWAFNPWWLLGAAALIGGIAAIASSGGGGGGSSTPAKDTTAPNKPSVVANDDGSVTVTPATDATKTSVTYTDENGNTKTVEFTKGSDGKWVDNNPNDGITVDPNTGVVTIPEDQVKDGTDVTAVTEDETGNESDPGSDTAKDVTPPTAPDVKANDDGSVTVTPSDDSTKTTVEYTDEDGNSQTATFTKDPNTGKWVDDNPNDSITVDPDTGVVTIPEDAVKDGTDVTAVTEDETGNESDPGSDTAKDVTPPTAPDVKANDDGSVTVTPSDDSTKTTVEYTDEDGNSQTATFTKDPDTGKWVDDNPNDSITVDPDTGVVTIPEEAVKDGTDVTAVTEDEAGNESDPDSDTAKDVTPPTAPDVKANDDGSVTVTPSDDSTKTTVEYTDEDGNSQTATFTKDPDTGKWVDDNPNDSITVDPDTGVVTIPEDAVKDGSDVTAVTEDEAGNESDPDSDTAKDLADSPTVTPSTSDGSVTVTPGGDNTKLEITYTDEDGAKQTVTFTKDPDTGKWVDGNPNDGVSINPDTGIVTIPQDAVEDGSTVTAVGTNDADNSAEGKGDAGTDSKNAAVDPSTDPNTGASNGVVTTTPTDEGNSLVTTVKLTNNNGVDNLTVATSGTTTADDFGTPVYTYVDAKGDTQTITPNADGTINVPAGVTEFKITTPVTADNSTEGDETVTYTVGGVNGNEATINDTSTTDSADEPTVTPSTTDGSVTVTPGDDNTTLEITYTDENGDDQTVDFTKGDDGKWVDNNPNDSITIDPDTGLVTIPQDAVEDGSTVTAKGTNDAGNSATDDGTAGTDSKNATVDPSTDPNTGAGVGVVTTTPVDEGGNLVTTVKLTNNNGADNLSVSTSGTATGDDFGTPVYTYTDKDGATHTITPNTDGTINVPAGVTEFTITTPVVADTTTEGAETVTYTVGGVNGNEATINDTSTTDSADEPTVTPSTTDGSVTVTPGTDNTKLEIEYTDENGDDQTVDFTKGDDGKWVDNNPNDSITIDPDTGLVTIPQDAVEDGSTVTAKGTNDAGNSATDDGTAGIDSKNATVDPSTDPNTGAGVGVVTTTPVDEGGNLVTTVKLTNNNGADNLSVSTSGTATGDDFGTPVYSYVDADGNTQTITPNTDGTINVPAGVTEFKITTPVVADNSTEGDETVTYTVGGVIGNEATIKDISLSPATSITVTITDNFADEFNGATVGTEGQEAIDKLTAAGMDKYKGTIGSDGLEITDVSTLTSLGAGLTNDATPEVSFTLNNPLSADQTLVVYRETVVDGRTFAKEVIDVATLQVSADGKTYSFTDNLGETFGTQYRYTAEIQDTAGDVTASTSQDIYLDTLIEALEVTNFTTQSLTFKLENSSEHGMTITYTYPTGASGTQSGIAKDNGDGTYTLNFQAGLDRYNVEGIKLTVQDAAGNISETKVNAIRNLFTEYSLEQGPNPANKAAYDDSLFTASGSSEQSRNVATAADGGLVATNGNDTLIVGLDEFGGFGVSNGSIAHPAGVINSVPFKVNMGAGDDYLQVRGTAQSLYDHVIDMGEGNDKITVGNSLVVGKYTLEMGEGNNLLAIGDHIAQATTFIANFGSGDDTMTVGTNLATGNGTINFGDGNNSLIVGGYLSGDSDITFGSGDDIVSIGSNLDQGKTIEMGDGNNLLHIGGYFNHSTVNMGSGEDTVDINEFGATALISTPTLNTGAGADTVKIAAYQEGNLNLGEDDDTVTVSGVLRGGLINGGDGEDTLIVTSTDSFSFSMNNVVNVEVIDLTAIGRQDVNITLKDLTQSNDGLKAIYIKGDNSDTVDFGDNNGYNNLKADLEDTSVSGIINRGSWQQDTTGTVTIDGVTYDKYIYGTTTNPGASDEVVYVQQGVQII